MKPLCRLVLLTLLFAAAACSSPVALEPAASPALNTAPVPPPQTEDQLATTADSITARGGGNLMGGN